MPSPDRADRVCGALLGCALGDSLGLPREGLSRRRAERIFGGGPLHHRFLLGRGMLSDDTEHACMTAQAVLSARGDSTAFARSLAWRLRGWLCGMPAGIGWATLRSILKLWLGFSPSRSGVWSAGNGPAMRAPMLGVCFAANPELLRAYVAASTQLTHRDPKAEQGAWVIAAAAAAASTAGPDLDTLHLSRQLSAGVVDVELRGALVRITAALESGADAASVASEMGLLNGVTGYVVHTVPLALFCWLRHPFDARAALTEVIALGGDTDTTGAITGALVGAAIGASRLPEEWLRGIVEWPRTVAWMRALAGRVAGSLEGAAGSPTLGPLPLFWWGLLPRNLFFAWVVLLHGFRRLLPPY